jgi:hypothetical protein
MDGIQCFHTQEDADTKLNFGSPELPKTGPTLSTRMLSQMCDTQTRQESTNMGDFDDSFRPEASQTTTRLVERILPEQGPAESNDTLVSLTAPTLTKINDKTRPKSAFTEAKFVC